MPDKVLLKLLLVLTWTLAVEAMPPMRQCSHDIPTSCMANTNIQLTKKTDHYDLQLCSNGRCIPGTGQEKWIRCNRMCDTCESMAGSSCGRDEDQCESQVSTFLDNYCQRNTPSTTTTTSTATVRSTVTTTTRIHTTVTIPKTQRVTTTNTEVVTTTLPCQTLTSISTKTVTQELTSKTCDILASEGSSKASTSVQHTAPVAALGALLGLFMILLTIVTAGWVWTLCVMKRKKSERAAR